MHHHLPGHHLCLLNQWEGRPALLHLAHPARVHHHLPGHHLEGLRPHYLLNWGCRGRPSGHHHPDRLHPFVHHRVDHLSDQFRRVSHHHPDRLHPFVHHRVDHLSDQFRRVSHHHPDLRRPLHLRQHRPLGFFDRLHLHLHHLGRHPEPDPHPHRRQPDQCPPQYL